MAKDTRIKTYLIFLPLSLFGLMPPALSGGKPAVPAQFRHRLSSPNAFSSL